MPKQKQDKQSMIIVVFFALLFVAGLVLWITLFKNNEPKKAVAPAPENQNTPREIYFASNGKNTVYKIKKDNDKWSVIWNGTEGKEYDFVSNPVFSADGTQLAYNAEVGGQAYVVVNNQFEITAYQKAGYIVFSRDGETIAFVASKENGSSVIITSSTNQASGSVVSGEESREYTKIAIIETSSGEKQAIVLGETGNQIAYAFEENGKTYLVINGRETQGYDEITGFTFNANGTYSYEAQNGTIVITVINGVVVSTATAQTNSNTSNNNPSNTNNPTNNSKPYKYRISTQKDINLENSTEEACPGGNCNF